MSALPMPAGRLLAVSALIVAVLLAMPTRALFGQAAGTTTLVSAASDGGAANNDSLNASVSGDGRYVVFDSDASNLVSGDTNVARDVFVRDRQTGQTVRVSVASDGTEGNGRSQAGSISADGRYVVFDSDASNLVPNDTNAKADVFVHDRQTSQTQRVSVLSGGGQLDGPSQDAGISADGRYVVFRSQASNLNGVVVYDRQTGQSAGVSKDVDGKAAAGTEPSISADGRYVVYSSDQTNLVVGDDNGKADVFVYDRDTGQTSRVSVSSGGAQGNGHSRLTGSLETLGGDRRVISADGRYVVFGSDASNVVSGDTNGVFDVFVRDRQAGQTTRVSVASDGTQANGSSSMPAISADGRYVTFQSDATNLVAGDTNNVADIFVHDRQTSQTTRVSVSSSGSQGGDASGDPAISSDGRYLAFASNARNLVSGSGLWANIFVHDREAAAAPTATVVVSVTPTPTPTPSPTPTASPTVAPTVPITKNRSAGCQVCPPQAGEPVQTGTGELFIEPEVDVSLGGPLPLLFSRSYGSRLWLEGEVRSSLGPSWMHNFDLKATVSDRGQTAKVVYGRGNILNFRKVDGTTWTLQSNADDTEEVSYQLREDASGELWLLDPIRNRIWHFRASGVGGQLSEVRDRNGNTLTLTYDTTGRLTRVSDGLGRTLSFSYDAGGNLTQVADGVRTLTYGYTSGVLTSFTDALGNRTTYSYDTVRPGGAALLTAVQRPLGNRRHTQSYDLQGRVVTQTDALSNTLTLRYDTPSPGITTITDALGRTRTNTQARERVITETVDARGKTATVARDDRDRPTAVTDQLGNTTSFSYDAESGLPASVTDARGNTGSLSYVSQVQTFGTITFTFRAIARASYPDGTTAQFSYDANGNPTSTVDRAGGTLSYTYNARGQVLTTTNPEGGVITSTYHADGTLASTGDGDTGTIAFEYDALKRLTKVTHPDGTFSRAEYDLNDRIIAQTDENGRTTTYTYDANGNVTALTNPLGTTIRSTYDQMDRNTESTDALGKQSQTTYDALGRTASWTDPNGNTTRFGYNENGWQVQMTDGAGKVWQTGYDDRGRKTAETTPLGRTSRYEWDQLGNRTTITDPLGNRVTMTYDSASRVTAATDPLSRTVQFGHDRLGQLASLTPFNLGTATYTRTKLGRLAGLTDLRGKTWSFGTTAMGRLSSTRDPLGRETRYRYDSRARLSQVTYPTGETQTLTYDGVGNLVRAVHSDGTVITSTYDVLDRLVATNGVALNYDAGSNVTSTRDGDVDFGATYDDGQRLTTLIYNNGAFTVTYRYDRRDLLTGVSDSLTGGSVSLSYDDDGRLVRLARSNGITTTYTWDAGSRLTRIQDGTVADQQLGYNAASEVTQVTQTLPVDPASLLNARTDGLTYDDASQVSAAGYTYDARGRQTASPAHSFSWDGAGRITSTGTATLEYNGLGNVVRRTELSTTIHYYYHHAVELNPIMAERDEATGRFLRYYVWAPDGSLLYLIDVAAGNKPSFYHFDQAGSTLFLTDATGAVADAYAYTPYGVLLGHSGSSAQPFTFIGRYGVRQEGSSGLYQMRTRYYDARTARFLSRDAAWPVTESWAGLNPYLYARANPVKFVDPTGRFASVFVNWFIKVVVKRVGKEVGERLALAVAKKTATTAAGEGAKEVATWTAMSSARSELERAKDRVYDVAVETLQMYEEAQESKDWGDWINDLADPTSLIRDGRDVAQLFAIADVLKEVEQAGPDTSPEQLLRQLEQIVGFEALVRGNTYAGRVGKAALEEFLAQFAAKYASQLEELFCLIEGYGIRDVDDLLYVLRRGMLPSASQNPTGEERVALERGGSMIRAAFGKAGGGESRAAIVVLFEKRILEKNRPINVQQVPY